MRRVVCVLIVSSIILIPALSRADEMNESRTPNEYTQEESHPLRIVSYIVTPVGFILEWTVARPLHYIASETFLAPALDSEYGYEERPVPVEELPPTTLPEAAVPPQKPALKEESLSRRAPAAAPAPSVPTESAQPSAPAPTAPSESTGQPVLH
jgi:hypothetical protein